MARLRPFGGRGYGGQARLSLSARLRALTGLDWRVAVARVPLSPDRLTPGERRLLDALHAPVRREEWLRGRAALRRLVGDTCRLSFPHERCSLTHAGGVAVAVWCDAKGTGVDLEVRAPSERLARRFLSASEVAGACDPDGWLRLWTVKEACFKADLSNAGTAITAYEMDAPGARSGVAHRRGTASFFRYASFRAFGGWLSVAVSVKMPRT